MEAVAGVAVVGVAVVGVAVAAGVAADVEGEAGSLDCEEGADGWASDRWRTWQAVPTEVRQEHHSQTRRRWEVICLPSESRARGGYGSSG